MQHRDDIKGGTLPPEDIQQALIRFGGKTPHGEPMYRLVIAESVYQKSGGRWHDWDASLSLAERGGMVCDMSDSGEFRGIHSLHRPIRVVDEIREVQKYPHMQGWLLERWLPAYMFGSQEAWYRMTAKVEELTEDHHGQTINKLTDTGLPILGPYPERGDYMLVAGPRADVIGVGELQEVIATVERLRDTFIGQSKGEIEKRIYEAQYAQDERDRKARDEQEAAIRDALKPLLSTSLEMGAYRNKLAERAGLTSHEGN
jgi:hypothetical protein